MGLSGPIILFFSLLLGPPPSQQLRGPSLCSCSSDGSEVNGHLFDIILLWSGSNGHLFDIILLVRSCCAHLFDIILLWSEVNGHLFDIILLVRSCCALGNSLGLYDGSGGVVGCWGGGGYNNQRGHSLGFYNREETKKKFAQWLLPGGGVTTSPSVGF